LNTFSSPHAPDPMLDEDLPEPLGINEDGTEWSALEKYDQADALLVHDLFKAGLLPDDFFDDYKPLEA